MGCLAATGASIWPLVGLGAGLLVAGVLLVVATRARRTRLGQVSAVVLGGLVLAIATSTGGAGEAQAQTADCQPGSAPSAPVTSYTTTDAPVATTEVEPTTVEQTETQAPAEPATTMTDVPDATAPESTPTSQEPVPSTTVPTETDAPGPTSEAPAATDDPGNGDGTGGTTPETTGAEQPVTTSTVGQPANP